MRQQVDIVKHIFLSEEILIMKGEHHKQSVSFIDIFEADGILK